MRNLWYLLVLRKGQAPFDKAVTEDPVVTASAWDERVIGVTVIVVVSPLASTIGLASISVLLEFSAPSNSVVSTVADKLPPKTYRTSY